MKNLFNFFYLILLVLSFFSCKKEDVAIPISGFTNDTSECVVPDTINFRNTSQNAKIFRWNFGDTSAIEFSANPRHIFKKEGVYSVEMTAYGNGGMSVITKLVYILQRPVIDFSTNDTVIVAGDSVYFTGTLAKGVFPPTLLWSFGDGYNSSVLNPVHTYIYPGKFTVTLTATNSCGRTDVVKTNYIRVDSIITPPVADFIAAYTIIGVGQPDNFFDLSLHNPASWNWSFSGGTPVVSILKNPVGIIYSTPGKYDVTLSVLNSKGSNSITKSAYIHVLAPPIADFTANQTTLEVGGAVNFTDLTTNNPNAWVWIFQGASPNTSTVENPTGITYSASGFYNVTLTASNQLYSSSLTKTAFIQVNVPEVAPVSDFIAAYTIIGVGQPDNFFDLSTNVPTTWNWSFSGGTPSASTIQNPVGVIYSFPGTYNVTLTVSNATGSNSKTKTTYIQAIAPPIADFSASQTIITMGGSVNFTDLSSNNPNSWAWTFQGANPSSSSIANPIGIVYPSSGFYNVTFTASNQLYSSSLTKTSYIQVNAPGVAPVADFFASQTVITAGQSISFTDQSSNVPTLWNWSFQGANPTTSTLQNPAIVTYPTAGSYNVTLTSSNVYGSDTKTKTAYITVNPAGLAPVADFMVSQIIITAGQSVNFTDLSTNSPTAWNWSFSGANPSTSNLRNPLNISYSSAGTYSVTLTSSNIYGSETRTKTAYITVNPVGVAPVANFTVNQSMISPGQSINFTDLSTNQPTAWNWSFPGANPQNSNLQNPTSVSYPTQGIYNVTLTSSNTFGSNSITKNAYIVVGSVPVADFMANLTMISPGQSVNFTDLSINQPTSWNWSFMGANPANSTLRNPVNVTYPTSGTYNVTLTSTNAFGSNTKTKAAYIQVQSGFTKAYIKKITVQQISFPAIQMVNMYYKITDTLVPPTLLLDGTNQIVPNVTPASLPVIWNILPQFLVPTLNKSYKIELWDRKYMPYSNLIIGSVKFKLSNYTSGGNPYPQFIMLNQNNIIVQIELLWQ